MLYFAMILGLFALAMALANQRPQDRDRLERIERKLDLIMAHFEIVSPPPTDSEWQALAAEPGKKIAAIRIYREKYGVGLAEAKKSVEEFIRATNNKS